MGQGCKRPFEAWYEMYVKRWHPELAMVEMKIRNRLEPASTEKLVCVYSNSCHQNGGSDSRC